MSWRNDYGRDTHKSLVNGKDVVWSIDKSENTDRSTTFM